MKLSRIHVLFLLISTLFLASGASTPLPARDALSGPDPATPARLEESFGKLPLYFVENQGQVDDEVAYYLQGSDKTIYFSPQGVTFALSTPVTDTAASPPSLRPDGLSPATFRSEPDPPAMQRWAVKLDFVGANPDVHPVGLDQTEAIISYFKGQPDEWQAGLPTYSRIVYQDLWPGIDLVYYGTMDRLKYEFIVRPGADPAQIRLAYRGADVTLNESGQMEVNTPIGGFQDDVPVAYQEIDGQRVAVEMAYDLDEDDEGSSDRFYGFRVGSYDPTRPLVLDPAVIVYCGYIGGSGIEYGIDIAVDGAGYAYIAGNTYSTEATFPVTVGPDLTYNGGDSDAFVAKVSGDGTSLVYCGYIGGSGVESGSGIAVDGAGSAYITGWTDSTEATFPVTVGPDLTYNGDRDVFVAKVSGDGTSLHYCGYIGGSGFARGIAVDGSGSAYVTGLTFSTEATFPVTVGPDLTHNGYGDAFVAKVSGDGTSLVYCGYIGGLGYDDGIGIAVDGAGSAYVMGQTDSTEATFPVTVGPDLTHGGGTDTFVAKVSSDGTSLDYCGYIGGSGDDDGLGLAVDGAGSAYVTGHTDSTEATFPVTVGPDLTYNGGDTDAFVAKVCGDGRSLVYCGYIGGSSDWYDSGHGIAVDGSGSAYMTGATFSTEATFPVTAGPDLTHNGDYDAFVAKVSGDGMSLVYCGYIGGSGIDYGDGIAVDGAGSAYIIGRTASTEATFPVTVGPDLTYNGYYDAFVAKVSEAELSTYSVSGSVRDEGGNLVPGVTVSAGAGYQDVTGSGMYILTNLATGTYTLTPAKAGYTFSPSSIPVTVPPDVTGHDFIGTYVGGLTYSVSGHVRDADGESIQGVTVSTDQGQNTTTDANGMYTLTNLITGTYTITPSKADWTFEPSARTVSVPPDATGQDFIGEVLDPCLPSDLSGSASSDDQCFVVQPFLDLPIDYSYTNFATAALGSNDGAGPGRVNSWFDHEVPVFNDEYRDGYVRTFIGARIPNPHGVYTCTRGYNCYDTHSGVDFKIRAHETTEPVLAAAPGIVADVCRDWKNDPGSKGSGYGNYVLIRHPGTNYATLYAHLALVSPEVDKDKPIADGQHIGAIGSTGYSTGPHLHFGLYYNKNGDKYWTEDEVVDPYGYDPWQKPDPWRIPSIYLWKYPIVYQTLVSSTGAELTSPSGRATVQIPPGAVSSPVTAELWDAPPIAEPSEQLRSAGTQFWLRIPDGLQPSVAGETTASLDFTQPITLSVTYAADQLRHLDVDELRIYRWDENTSAWAGLLSTVDSSQQRVTALTTQVGSYDLQAPLLCPADSWEINDNYDGAKLVPTNGSATTQVFDIAEDEDWFRFQAEAGVTYTVKTSDLSVGVDTIIELYDTDAATLLAEDDDGGDGLGSRVVWTASTDRTLYVRVRPAEMSTTGCDAYYVLSAASQGPTPHRRVYLPLVLR